MCKTLHDRVVSNKTLEPDSKLDNIARMLFESLQPIILSMLSTRDSQHSRENENDNDSQNMWNDEENDLERGLLLQSAFRLLASLLSLSPTLAEFTKQFSLSLSRREWKDYSLMICVGRVLAITLIYHIYSTKNISWSQSCSFRSSLLAFDNDHFLSDLQGSTSLAVASAFSLTIQCLCFVDAAVSFGVFLID
jgi:hypothetical protein